MKRPFTIIWQWWDDSDSTSVDHVFAESNQNAIIEAIPAIAGDNEGVSGIEVIAIYEGHLTNLYKFGG